MDTNFYPYPLPIIPVMDWAKKEIIRIDELATGGNSDLLNAKTHKEGILDHCASGEYVPELLPGGTRKDLKPLNVTQPEGPSFTVSDGQLIEWQRWRFRGTGDSFRLVTIIAAVHRVVLECRLSGERSY